MFGVQPSDLENKEICVMRLAGPEEPVTDDFKRIIKISMRNSRYSCEGKEFIVPVILDKTYRTNFCS